MTSPPSMPSPASCPADTLTVLYDGACPLCRREIALYRGLPASQPLTFVDASDTSVALPPGTDRARLLARFHVLRPDGSLADGARGFVALWAALPGWRWLARMAALPGVTPLMELGYRAFLHLRPAMQRVAAAFEPADLHLPDSLRGDLRSDHAGETGAVWIYRGVLAVARDAGVRAFARRHLATEREHLRLIAPLLPASARAAAAPLRALLARCQADECEHRDEATALGRGVPGPLLRAWCASVGSGSALAVKLARRL